MKVLHIINSMATGGAEKLLLDTIPKYNKQGVKTDLLVLNGKQHTFLKQLIDKICCSVFSISHGSVYNPFLIFKIIPYLKKYDIIHVHLFPAQYWVAIAKIISFSNVKLVFTEHNTTNRRLKNKIFSFFNKFIYKYYDKTICITQEIFNLYINYTKLYRNKFLVIENGVDLSTIKQASIYEKHQIHPHITNNNKLILQVSSFRDQKDQPTAIRAMNHLPENIKLLLVGEGELRLQCEKMVEGLSLKKRVFFLGNRYDVPNLLKSVDIVVLSSHHEGLSLSCIEGMASGKPFVASNVPGLSNLVSGAGVLFPLGDAKALASTINQLLTDQNHYNSVVENCLLKARQYDIKIMVDKHISLYKMLLNK